MNKYPPIIKFIKTGFEMFTVQVDLNNNVIEKEQVHLSNRHDVAEQIIREMKESK